MQKFSKIFLILGIVGAILLVGGLIGWLAGGAGSKHLASPTDSTTVDSHPAISSPGGVAPTNQLASKPVKNPTVVEGEAVQPPSLPPGILTNWEDRLEEIIGAEIDETNKVEQLFALFPHVPAESKAEVAQHLSNLVTDENYAPLGELLKDRALDSDTLDVLMQDVLGRPNSLKLPELLAVAQTPNHSKADEAKDFLSLFLEEDYADDWGKWHDKMTAWLKDNPD